MSNQYYTPDPTPPGHPTVTIQHYEYDHPYPYPYTTPPQPIPQFTFGDIHDSPQVPTPMNMNGYYPNNIQFHESSVFPVPPPVQQPKEIEPEAPTTQSKRHHYSKEQTEYLLVRFAENTHPSKERKLEISQAIGVTFQQVSTWFTNRSVLFICSCVKILRADLQESDSQGGSCCCRCRCRRCWPFYLCIYFIDHTFETGFRLDIEAIIHSPAETYNLHISRSNPNAPPSIQYLGRYPSPEISSPNQYQPQRLTHVFHSIRRNACCIYISDTLPYTIYSAFSHASREFPGNRTIIRICTSRIQRSEAPIHR